MTFYFSVLGIRMSANRSVHFKISSFLIVFISFITIILSIARNNFNVDSSDQNLVLIRKNEVRSILKCDPINHDHKQFTVEINNQKYPKSLKLNQNQSINFTCLNESKKIKRLLLWTTFYVNLNYLGYDMGVIEPFAKNSCPITNCELLNDKSRINESDLVITYMIDYIQQPPKYRLENQKWVFQMFESPFKKKDFSQYNNFYNLTSTYKTDSDFPGCYEGGSKMKWIINESFDPNYDYSLGKTKLAAAIISNCQTGHDRLDYIKELQMFIQTDVYGKCGTKKCNNLSVVNSKEDCKASIAKEYKFYLAFENSICDDYITEKFFYILQYDIVPVVRGGGNYEYYVPKSGFIDVFDFESPRHLAAHLNYLNLNHTAYNEYFKWKQFVKFDRDNSLICDMCIYLHLEEYFGVAKKTIYDIEDHWSRSRDCKDLFRYICCLKFIYLSCLF